MKADDIRHFLSGSCRSRGALEAAHAVRLELVRQPDALHRARATMWQSHLPSLARSNTWSLCAANTTRERHDISTTLSAGIDLAFCRACASCSTATRRDLHRRNAACQRQAIGASST